MSPLKLMAVIAIGGILAGCSGIQSALAPAGDDAAEIARLTWILNIAGFAILAVVVVLAVLAVFAPDRSRRWAGNTTFILAGGVVFPAVALSVLLIYGLLLENRTWRTEGEARLRIAVIGEQFWWRVSYAESAPDATSAPQQLFATANELRIPVGTPVTVTLQSNDVIHSFWIPSLAGKLDMIPGHVNRMTLRADRAGIYRGQCAEFCGDQHAQMAFYVIAQEEAEFRRWLESQRQPAATPAVELAQAGGRLFIASGCGACHSVRGTPATGTIGPDLTHIGSRHSIAAGMLPNNVGTLAAWIASAQHLKPGNKMPSFGVLPGPDLRAIASYLESLK